MTEPPSPRDEAETQPGHDALDPSVTHAHVASDGGPSSARHDFRAASSRALKGALVLLAVIFVVELVGGLVSGSLALLADAGHLLTDVAAVALALLAQWFSKRPPSASKSYGFRRTEILAALVNGVTLWGIALYIVYEAVVRLRHPPEVASLTMVLIAGVGLVVQIGAAVILARAAGESLNVKGAYLHAATDALQSAVVVVVGLTMMATGWWLLDPLASMVIAVLIAWSGGRVVWEATHVLLEGTPSDVDLAEIARKICACPGVCRVTDLHAWSITTGYNALSAHVEALPGLTAEDRESLRETISQVLSTEFALHHVTLQVETGCTMPETAACSAWVTSALTEER